MGVNEIPIIFNKFSLLIFSPKKSLSNISVEKNKNKNMTIGIVAAMVLDTLNKTL